MTRSDLTKLFQEAAGITGVQAKEYLGRLGDILTAEILAGGEAPFFGMGKLMAVRRAARKGRNPRTGETIAIPARRTLSVTVFKEMKEALK